MRIALLQLDPTVGDLEANADKILRAATRARDLGADLAVTSELALVGYPPRDLVERASFVAAVLEQNRRVVDELPEGIALVFGTLESRAGAEGKPLYNSAIVAKRA